MTAMNRLADVSLAIIAAVGLASAGSWTQDSDASYRALAEKAKAGDRSIDFRALRLACSNASKCDARGDSKDLLAMHRAAKARDYKLSLKLAEKLIAAGFPNIEAHAACAEAYAALNDPEKAKFHHAITAGLIQSILSTGDGKTKETAFEVIGTYEERIVMTVLGLPPFGRQGLIPGKPHSYDVLEVDDPKTGNKVSVYFNIDAFYPMKGLE